jgi:hypothetical protein
MLEVVRTKRKELILSAPCSALFALSSLQTFYLFDYNFANGFGFAFFAFG